MKILAIVFMVYFSGLSFMPCDTDIFHSDTTTECSDRHEDQTHEGENPHHEDGTSHCACHCHHIQAYFQIRNIEVASIIEPTAHASFYQNRVNDSHLHGLFKPPQV